jgi:hypothetical protein
VSFGPLSAYTHDLSSQQCTANDVRIVGGFGQIINEPCPCTGTFNAVVQFTVENNASSARGYIILHLAGGPFPVADILLNNGAAILDKTTQTMTGTIANFPCGVGEVCFGLPGEEIRGRCSAPCSTVSWTVPGRIPARLTGSSPRSAVTSRSAFGGAASPRSTATLQSMASRQTDNTGCASSASTDLTTTPVATPLVTAGAPDCDCNVDYTVTNCDSNLTYIWFEVDCSTGDHIGSSIGTGCNLSHTGRRTALSIVSSSRRATARRRATRRRK